MEPIGQMEQKILCLYIGKFEIDLECRLQVDTSVSLSLQEFGYAAAASFCVELLFCFVDDLLILHENRRRC